MKKVLVTGANGQLGKSIQAIANTLAGLSFLYKSSSELDISKEEDVKEDFLKENYDWCINCAAYTSVDKAEIEKDKAYSVNVLGVKNIANSCKNYSVKLIHISTDFVFDGEKQFPYLEVDTPNPKTVYGLTKLQGELEIKQILKEYFIIRTSWLYSEFGNNFMKTMLVLAEDRDEISVVSDQIGTPTHAIDLSKLILKIISDNNNKYGLYHFSNEGEASWATFAEEIFKLKGIKCRVKPILTKEYISLALRPKYSVFKKEKVKEAFDVIIPNWKYSLKKY
ncbi:dTDP-4-dehydrorhamnose reductase [Pseudofulvibacter geojedonensis]|uniref:dTDP-4-dehydrorhamnose reductase n=1 Tax=Pseudofulvibacter geojedonensis TaxID=1123758 RepID=A0ABW3I4Q3_9FLAO